jgi:hypothetical protein
MQLLGIDSMIERTLIVKTLKLTHVADFAFAISIMQAEARFLLLRKTVFASGLLSVTVLLVIPIFNVR